MRWPVAGTSAVVEHISHFPKRRKTCSLNFPAEGFRILMQLIIHSHTPNKQRLRFRDWRSEENYFCADHQEKCDDRDNITDAHKSSFDCNGLMRRRRHRVDSL